MDQITARDSRNLLRAVQTLNVSLDLSTLAQRTIAAVNRANHRRNLGDGEKAPRAYL
jgi:hypothetical protein